jgi:hypothetical protein
MASAFSGLYGPKDRRAMSLLHPALVIASGVQGGGPHPPPAKDTLLVVLLIAAMAALAALVFLYMRRRGRRIEPVNDQWQALAVMGELCPHGWQVQVTLYGWGAPLPEDAPPWRVPLVEVEWKQYEEESEQVAVTRRVWAPTIDRALQTMVEDRRTEITLEQIEQAVADEEWND